MADREERIQKFRQRRDELRAELAAVGDMRPGSLAERYRRCGKPNCRCAQEGDPGHGPSFSLTRTVEGKTVTKIIPAKAVERTRRQMAEYHRYRTLGQELVEASEHLCDAQVRWGDEAASPEAAEKKGSRKPSTRKSSPRSKPS